MVSIRQLFETPVLNMPKAENPMDSARSYVNDRISNLKRQFAFGRIRASAYQQQLKDLTKQKNDKLSGTFVEK